MNIVKIDLSKLKPTEHHSVDHAKWLKNILGTTNEDWPPILVSTDMFILDGHHRFQLAKDLGFEKILAYLIDYFDPDLEVRDHNTNEFMDKEMLLSRYFNGDLLPIKTTKHIIRKRNE